VLSGEDATNRPGFAKIRGEVTVPVRSE